MFQAVFSDSGCHEKNLMFNGETASVSNARFSVKTLISLLFHPMIFSGQLWIARCSVTTQDVATGHGCQASVN